MDTRLIVGGAIAVAVVVALYFFLSPSSDSDSDAKQKKVDPAQAPAPTPSGNPSSGGQPSSNGTVQKCLVQPPGGYFCPSETSVPKQCAPGTYSTVVSAAPLSVCSSCPTNKYCPAGSSQPANCPDGTECPDGKTSTGCPVGVYCTGGVRSPCPAGAYCPVRAAAPVPCPPNSYCPPGASGATPCAAGATSPVSSKAASDCANPPSSFGGWTTYPNTILSYQGRQYGSLANDMRPGKGNIETFPLDQMAAKVNSARAESALQSMSYNSWEKGRLDKFYEDTDKWNGKIHLLKAPGWTSVVSNGSAITSTVYTEDTFPKGGA